MSDDKIACVAVVAVLRPDGLPDDLVSAVKAGERYDFHGPDGNEVMTDNRWVVAFDGAYFDDFRVMSSEEALREVGIELREDEVAVVNLCTYGISHRCAPGTAVQSRLRDLTAWCTKKSVTLGFTFSVKVTIVTI